MDFFKLSSKGSALVSAVADFPTPMLKAYCTYFVSPPARSHCGLFYNLFADQLHAGLLLISNCITICNTVQNRYKCTISTSRSTSLKVRIVFIPRVYFLEFSSNFLGWNRMTVFAKARLSGLTASLEGARVHSTSSSSQLTMPIFTWRLRVNPSLKDIVSRDDMRLLQKIYFCLLYLQYSIER